MSLSIISAMIFFMAKLYVILWLEPVSILEEGKKKPIESAIFGHILHISHNPNFDDLKLLSKTLMNLDSSLESCF